MLRSRSSRWVAAGLAVALVAAAGTAVAQDRARNRALDRREGRAARFLKQRAMEKRREALRRMERLEALPDEQARVALAVSEEAVKVREAARDRAAVLLMQAFREAKASPERREEIRTRVREQVKALREEARASLTEAGRSAAAALTPEQRAKIEAKVKARGGTLDEDRLALGLAWKLSHPRARAFLRARLAR